jgi:hypothetical protein
VTRLEGGTTEGGDADGRKERNLRSEESRLGLEVGSVVYMLGF